MNRSKLASFGATAVGRLGVGVGVAVFTTLLAACSGHASGPSVARLSPTATGAPASGSPSAPSAQGTGALAFARCMRAHGLTGWPDPDGSGHFDKSTLLRLGYSPTQIRAVQDRFCAQLLPTGPAEQTISAQEQQDYLNAAACMRSHGIAGFPDPTFSDGHVSFSVPSSINTNSTQFVQARQTCTKLIPAGLPYSSPGQ